MTFIVLVWSMLISPAVLHSNVVGEIHIDNFENEIFLTATMDKRPLTIALMSEADCAPKDMLKVCGNDYLQNHIQFVINGKKLAPKMIAMEMQREHVVFKYHLASENELENLEIASDYMLAYHDQSLVKIILSVKNLSRQISLGQKRPSINFDLN